MQVLRKMCYNYTQNITKSNFKMTKWMGMEEKEREKVREVNASFNG